MRRILWLLPALIALSAGVMLGAGISQAALHTMELRLTGFGTNPNASDADNAHATLVYDDVARRLTYALLADGPGPRHGQAAHIHYGRVIDSPVVHILHEGEFTRIEGSVLLTPEQDEYLRLGLLYVDVHSQRHPAGARAQLWIPVVGPRQCAITPIRTCVSSGPSTPTTEELERGTISPPRTGNGGLRH